VKKIETIITARSVNGDSMISVNTRRGELVTPLLVIVFAASVFLVSRTLPEARSGGPGADLYPMFISACLLILGVIQLIQNVAFDFQEPDGPPVTLEAARKLVVPVFALVAYILLLPVIGYLVGTMFYLVGFMRYSGITNYRRSVPVSVGIAIATQYIFGGILNVPLPEGIIPFARLLPMTVGVGV
jgi:uncharacterized membrane protein